MNILALSIDIQGQRKATEAFRVSEKDEAVALVIKTAKEFSHAYDECTTMEDVEAVGTEEMDEFIARLVTISIETENPLLGGREALKERQTEPINCVNCGSDEIDASGTEHDYEVAWRDVICKECDTIWVETFKFEGWEVKE